MILGKCKKCGESFGRLAILAMLADTGAVVVPGPLECSGGGEHDFEWEDVVPQDKPVQGNAP